ncbi:hypothetical protein QYQ77_04245 [Klebsiella pneumoniae]|uniref:hypothetical protein n=1 Tax=Klebsiella pneumoniae TaxID=573 RepID=UPI0026595F56|nr:hypothetical protein [Klebsiella pneumoniae]WKI47728.1 hypothetical protein QYQ77_04245 [Klebsiella pneumoniae]
MNRAATLTLNAPLLMLVAALALSTPFTAGAAPAFLDYAQQQTQQSQAQEKNDAASAKQTQESRQSADNKKKKQALCRIIIYSKARPRRVSRSSN